MSDPKTPVWKNKNVLVIAALVAAIAIVFGVSALTGRKSIENVVNGDSGNVTIEMNVPVAAATEAPATEAPATEVPTAEPTAEPTEAPTAEPTEAPTAEPTEAPTAEPTEVPTAEPTEVPTAEPTAEPTEVPASDTTAAAEEAADPCQITKNNMPEGWLKKPVEEKEANEEAAAPETASAPTSDPTGYVVVTTNSESRIFPVFPDYEYSFAVVQNMADGTEERNVIHIIENGVYMESSTCDNQDCVEEGTVTLENKDTRILYNWIICLPNGVQIELYTVEEVEAMIAEMQAQAGGQEASAQ